MMTLEDFFLHYNLMVRLLIFPCSPVAHHQHPSTACDGVWEPELPGEPQHPEQQINEHPRGDNGAHYGHVTYGGDNGWVQCAWIGSCPGPVTNVEFPSSLPVRQSFAVHVRADVVPAPAAGAEEPWWRDDAEEASSVHDAERAPRVLCWEHADRTDELRHEDPHSQWSGGTVNSGRLVTESELVDCGVDCCILVDRRSWQVRYSKEKSDWGGIDGSKVCGHVSGFAHLWLCAIQETEGREGRII